MKTFINISAVVMLLCLCACNNRMTQPEDILPVLDITVPVGAKYSKDVWTKDCRLVIDNDTLLCDIKGRGHSTFNMPKHPYNIRLKDSLSILGLPGHHRFVLLANFFDHSLMRNALALEVARMTSMKDYTPHSKYARVKVNGEDMGVYLVCERVKDMVSDSLLKIDSYHIKEQLTEDKRPDTIPDLPIDTLSFVDYWLVQELCMNAEPNGPRSCYMHVSKEGKLIAGPVWDYDMAFNPVGIDNGGDLRPYRFRKNRPEWLKDKLILWETTDSIYNRNSLLYANLLADASFRQKITDRWNALKPRFKSLKHAMKLCNKYIGAEAEEDQQRWNSLEPARFDSCTTYHSAYKTLKKRYKKRIKALDAIINRK